MILISHIIEDRYYGLLFLCLLTFLYERLSNFSSVVFLFWVTKIWMPSKTKKNCLRSSSLPCAGNDMGLRENSMQSQDLLGMTDYLPVVFRALVFHCIGHDMGLREISMQIDLEASDR